MAHAAAAQQARRVLLDGGQQLADPADDLQRGAGGPPVGDLGVPVGRGRLRAGAGRSVGPVAAQGQPVLPGQLHGGGVHPGEQAAAQQPAGGRGVGGVAPGGVVDRQAAQRVVLRQGGQHRPLLVVHLGQVALDVGRRRGAGPAETGGEPDGAAHRLGCVHDVVAPQQGAGGQQLQGRLHRGPGERRGQLRPAQAVGRGEQDGVEHLQGAGVQLVQRAVHRHRHGQAGGQPHDVGGGRAGDVRAQGQQCPQLLVGAGAQPRGQRGGGVGGHLVHATSPRGWQHRHVPGALDDPTTRTDLAATRAGALRWVAGGAIALVLAVLLGLATVQTASSGGPRLPFAGLVVVALVLLGLAGLGAGAGSLLRVTAWGRGLATTPWRTGRLRIAGPAVLRVEPGDGGEDVDLRLLSTATWRTRAVQRLDGREIRFAAVGEGRWVLTADGQGTLYGARRP